MRTRIKICGLTRRGDVVDAIRAGADAIGLVFYPPSPRAVTIEQARELCRGLPPFITVVGLFVNENRQRVQQTIDALPINLLQFHGEEDAAFCTSFGRPYMKAARVKGAFDLVDYAAGHPQARAILLDAWVDGYGGGGQPFDWSVVPAERPVPLVLAGGLNAHNVCEAIRVVRPWAVDVSSGVETAKGIKDRGLMEAFVAGVRDADA